MARLDDLVRERDALRDRILRATEDPATLAGTAESLGLDPADEAGQASFRGRRLALVDLRTREQALSDEIRRIEQTQLAPEVAVVPRNLNETPTVPTGPGRGRYHDVFRRGRGF